MAQQRTNGIQPVRLPTTSQRFGYVVADADMRVREVSSSFQRLVGETQIGVQLGDVLYAFAGMESSLRSIVQAELPYWYLQGVSHARDDEGELSYFDILTLPDWSEEGLFVVVRDVTAEKVISRRFVQKRNEAQLQARQDSQKKSINGKDAIIVEDTRQMAAKAFKELDQTLGVPTTAMIGQCQRLLEQPSTTEELLVIQMVLATCLEIDQVATQLLATERLEVMVPLKMMALVRDSVSIYQPWAESFGIEIDISAEEIRIVLGFSALLRAALTFLLIDGIHRSPQDGRIDLTVRSENQGVLIEISGQDADPTTIANSSSFEVHWQSQIMDASAATRATQAGLHLVQVIASVHEGRLWAERHSGGESDLCLWVPTGVEPPPGTISEGGSS